MTVAAEFACPECGNAEARTLPWRPDFSHVTCLLCGTQYTPLLKRLVRSDQAPTTTFIVVEGDEDRPLAFSVGHSDHWRRLVRDVLARDAIARDLLAMQSLYMMPGQRQEDVPVALPRRLGMTHAHVDDAILTMRPYTEPFRYLSVGFENEDKVDAYHCKPSDGRQENPKCQVKAAGGKHCNLRGGDPTQRCGSCRAVAAEEEKRVESRSGRRSGKRSRTW